MFSVLHCVQQIDFPNTKLPVKLDLYYVTHPKPKYHSDGLNGFLKSLKSIQAFFFFNHCGSEAELKDPAVIRTRATACWDLAPVMGTGSWRQLWGKSRKPNAKSTTFAHLGGRFTDDSYTLSFFPPLKMSNDPVTKING